MTKKELIEELDGFEDDSVVVLCYGGGWSNIDMAIETPCTIELHAEKYPVFSDD